MFGTCFDEVEVSNSLEGGRDLLVMVLIGATGMLLDLVLDFCSNLVEGPWNDFLGGVAELKSAEGRFVF